MDDDAPIEKIVMYNQTRDDREWLRAVIVGRVRLCRRWTLCWRPRFGVYSVVGYLSLPRRDTSMSASVSSLYHTIPPPLVASLGLTSKAFPSENQSARAIGDDVSNKSLHSHSTQSPIGINRPIDKRTGNGASGNETETKVNTSLHHQQSNQ